MAVGSADRRWIRQKGFGDDATIMVRERRAARSTALSGRRQCATPAA
jgi:hypothetical protein